MIKLLLEYLFYFRFCKNWRSIIANRRNGTILNEFCLRNGRVITFEGPPPWVVFHDIWRYKVYTKTYKPSFRYPRVVVDIGANIGLFSLYAAARWPSAQILAYEPDPENFRILQKNVRLSKAMNVQTFPFAVSDCNAKAKLYLRTGSGWHSLFDSSEGILRIIEVETVTIDMILQQIISRHIDFLKVDCEGAEFKILKGQEKLLSQSVGYVAMEYHEIEGDARILEDILRTAGFSIEVYPDHRWKTGLFFARNPRFY